MDAPFLPEDSPLEVCTAEERPDLWEAAREQFGGVWPEYNNHGNEMGRLFGALVPEYAQLQILLYDRSLARAVARGRTIAFGWDGSLEDLPSGMDALVRRALDEHRPPTALSALAAEVDPELRGRQLSRLVILAMAASARSAGLSALVAPVRPNHKDRYPLIPIARYATWTRDDGSVFDPWLRVHHRLGAVVLRPEPRSLRIEAPVPEWEAWTAMAFPDDGEYVFPAGLAPLTVRGGVGCYWEPNVWMQHPL